MSQLETRHITLEGKKVRYMHGGTGKPLVFLHRWPTNPLSYKHALTLLAHRFTVYAPFMFDMNCRNISVIAASVKSFAKQLGLQKVALVGTSFGALVQCPV